MKKPVDRTVVVAIDLSRAFDTVDHDLLLQDIDELDLNEHIKRFLCAYIRGRQTYVEFRGSKSRYRTMRQGVPQGGVLSPLLFNLYMTKMPPPPTGIKLSTYADDTTVSGSCYKIVPISEEINKYLDTLDNWFRERNLFISAPKSTATVFTTAPNEVSTDLPVYINGDKVPSVKQPKILGVTFDNQFTFRHHADIVKKKVQKRNNILKALAGTTWGKEKEVIPPTYKAIGQSVIDYCCPIWGPSLCDSKWDELQTAQNAALRTALGCVSITSKDHLHSESKTMPVRDHCEMLSKQFLLSTQQQTHPNNININTVRPRKMKNTLSSRHGQYINNLMSNNQDRCHKSLLKQIHTEAVAATMAAQADNRVLGIPPPDVDKSKRRLPRRTRSLLSQLRSGHSSMLNSHIARIRKDPTLYICPDCNNQSHTTNHLFNCPSKPTDLTPTSLWTKPADAARFLGLLEGQEFNDNG